MFRFRKRACTHSERILSGGKPILCLCVAGILLASIFLPETYVFPRNAYAEESTNSTSEQNTVISLNDTNQNSTDVVVANQNSTDVVVANQNSTAVTNDTSTNSTDVVVANQYSTAVTTDNQKSTTVTHDISSISQDVSVANQNSTDVAADNNTTSADTTEDDTR